MTMIAMRNVRWIPRHRGVIAWGILSVLFGGAWARSYLYMEGMSWVWNNGNQLSVSSSYGEFVFRFFRLQHDFSFNGTDSGHFGSSSLRGARPMRGYEWAWFHWDRTPPSPVPQGGYTQITQLLVPYWPLFWISLAGLIWSLRKTYRRVRAVASGHCPRCGYDLRGNSSGVCPECGATADGLSRSST